MGRKEKEVPQRREPRPVPERNIVDPETGERFVAKDAGSWFDAKNREEQEEILGNLKLNTDTLPQHSRKPSDGRVPTHKPNDWKDSN